METFIGEASVKAFIQALKVNTTFYRFKSYYKSQLVSF